MRPRILYSKLENGQIRQISEHEAQLHLVGGSIPRWDVPVVDLKNKEIIFACTLEEPTDDRK
jgi:hypothetical protein